MSLFRARMTACGLGLLFSILCLGPLAADTITANETTQTLNSVQFEIAPAPNASLVLALLDLSATRTHPALFAPDEQPAGPPPAHDSEPYGLSTVQAPPGALWMKWEKVEADIQAEAPALARCRANIRRCSPAAARFIAIVKKATAEHGRARLELVNERVNAAITYTTDMDQWRVSDLWSAPLSPHNKGAFDTGKGDCEDYAIAKYVALREAGVPSDDLKLLMVRDTSADTYHAVLAAYQDGEWLILDNRWSRLLTENDATFFTPLFALGTDGVKRFTTGGDRSARLKARKSPRRSYAAKPA